MNDIKYVQYGCGLSNPEGWSNFDSSPTLRIQKIPVIGQLVKSKLNVIFPPNIMYGDILKGLPIKQGTLKGIYCSHVLEHLSFEDCKIAVRNTYDLLSPGGIFRCVVPDLEIIARTYLDSLKEKNPESSNQFMRSSLLGVERRQHGIKGILNTSFGNSHHLWMWDKESLSAVLYDACFKSVRTCTFHDSKDAHFQLVEDESRFIDAVALEAVK